MTEIRIHDPAGFAAGIFFFGVIALGMGLLIGRWTKGRPTVIAGYTRDAKGHFGKAVKQP